MRRALLPAVLLLAACEATSPSTPADGPYPLTRLSPTPAVYENNSAGLTSPELGSVETQGAWDALYLRMKTGHIPMPTEGPELQFGDSTLVYAGIGYFPEGSTTVHLDSARIEEGGLVVHYTRTTLGALCGVPGAAIAPVDVAQVPRWEGSIRFVQRDSVEECD